MKSLLILLFVTCAFSSFLPKPTLTKSIYLPTPQNLLDFLVGNLVSLQVIENIPDAFPCVNALSSLQKNSENALKLFKSFHFVEGIHLLEKKFDKTIKICAAANSETFETFKNFLDVVRKPNFMKLALERLGNNKLEIIDDLAVGIEKLNNQSYFEAGVFLGKIPHTLLSGPLDLASIIFFDFSKDILKDPLADILKSLEEDVKAYDIFPQGEKCLNNLLGLKDSLNKVLNLLSQGNVLEALQLAEKTLKDGIAYCQKSLMKGTQLFQEFVQ